MMRWVFAVWLLLGGVAAAQPVVVTPPGLSGNAPPLTLGLPLTTNGTGSLTVSTSGVTTLNVPSGTNTVSANTGRTVTGATDSIATTDQGGVVIYNNGASAVAVTLPANSSRVSTDIFEIGSGLVTVTAASGGSLNGVANGYVNISANVDYHLVMAYNASGTAADWFIK